MMEMPGNLPSLDELEDLASALRTVIDLAEKFYEMEVPSLADLEDRAQALQNLIDLNEGARS